ncbi:hypothetical protein HPB51_012448 [Rhipicephalus microplus]|uniref:Uncharacterized protein n=1 Tax=Rhipicephalus microplus TaxID=6941 RepID=A0A9J6E9M0_RHIMP|nr:hypothetical protein HPB51_012448 [Rhipicephalus microplus]
MTHKPWQSDEFVLFEERQAIKCKFFKKGNFTVTLAPGYQGIPENLVINLVMWVYIVSLFRLHRGDKDHPSQSRSLLQHCHGVVTWPKEVDYRSKMKLFIRAKLVANK